MTKSTKELKISDQKRIDPIDKTKKTHHKTKFPPHWEIRNNGWIYPSKRLKESGEWRYVPHELYRFCSSESPDYKLIRELGKEGRLDEALAIYAKHHPSTINWPVRFINIQPMQTKREIL